MDPQAYHSPTYTLVSNNTYTYTNSTLISPIHLYQHTLISTLTLTLQPFTFTFSLSTQETQVNSSALLLKNCNHVSHHSLSSIETPGVRPLPRV